MNKLTEVIAAQSRLENLIVRKRATITANPVDVEHTKRQIIAAAKAFGVTNECYPRGYHLVVDSRNVNGFKLCLRGSSAQVSAEQFAFDVATGLLDEFNDYLESKLPAQKLIAGSGAE